MNKIYCITGATSDIGAELIKRILQNGHPTDKIIAQGHNDFNNISDLCAKGKDRIFTYDIDLTNTLALAHFIHDIPESVGFPTHIVHLPALRVINTKFKKFDEDRFALDMQVQISSAVKICKAFVPQMAKEKFGRVLFMLTSYVLGVPPKNTAAYIMAKETLRGLAKSLAADYAPKGVTVNCVAPYMMETKFLQDTPDLIVQASADANPMKRNATPQDVAPAMEFLLSDEASFITGITLPITGGSAV